MFASLCSPATTITTTTTTTMEYAPSPLSSAPLSSCSHVLPTTTLSFDPMEVEYITMPQGTKRKLNQLYQSMGELPRKGLKTEPVFKNKELLAAAKFEKKQHLRRWYNTLVTTPAYQAMTSLLVKETSMKSLFFRHKNNSFSFDFVALASNSEPTTTSSLAKSPSHDSAMYIFKANSKQVFTGDFTNVPEPCSAPSFAPSPAPSSAQDASMEDAQLPAAESAEVPLSHPSRLGNSILCRKKDRYESVAYTLASALKDVEKEVRTGKKPYTVHSTKTGHKPTGISKRSKTKGARHQPLTASKIYPSREEVEAEAGRRNRMPFIEIEHGDDDKDEPDTSPAIAASAPATVPAHVAPVYAPSVSGTAISASDQSRTMSKKKQKTSQRVSKSSKKSGVKKSHRHGKARSIRLAPESTAEKVTDFGKKAISLIKRNKALNKEDDFSMLFKKVLVDDGIGDGADFVTFS
ncbi:hypothetical protein QM012_004675 [Aureobasidium pullulans]|uniref:Uncharacterized protein n=1 Tax=Aureobasidium pullulans TaxID=5580 RepID=A0ABR0TTP5_AURPU